MKRITNSFFAILLCCLFSTVSYANADATWTAQKQMKLPAEASVLAYSTDGTRLAVGHADGRVSIWNLKTGELVHVLSAHAKEVNSVQFIQRDTKLLTIGGTGTSLSLQVQRVR